jgi:hypothetical protein
MAMGLDLSRPSRRASRGSGGSRPTVREVLLLGMARPAKSQVWTAGQRVTWLGRGYRVVATAATPPESIDDIGSSAPSTRHYIHLAPSDGG